MTVTVAEMEDLTAAETRRARLIRALARSPGPLSTCELADLLAEPGPRKRLLPRDCETLRREEQAGRVRRAAGRTTCRHGRAAVIWAVTDAGLAWLDEHDQARVLAVAAAAEAVRKAEEGRRAATERVRALNDARVFFDRQTSRRERKRVAHRLRDLGCTLDEIGLVFGVSKEMIRVDLLWDPEAPPRPRKPRDRPVGKGATTSRHLDPETGKSDPTCTLKILPAWP